MQRLEVSGAVRPLDGSLGVKRLTYSNRSMAEPQTNTVHPIIRKSPAGFRSRTLLVTTVMNMLW
jgi:hypothetical protein